MVEVIQKKTFHLVRVRNTQCFGRLKSPLVIFIVCNIKKEGQSDQELGEYQGGLQTLEELRRTNN